MDYNLSEVFRKILDPEFDFSTWNLEQFTQIGQEAVESETLQQRVLGRLAMELGKEHGQQTIKEFAKQVKKSPKTIYSYRDVERTLFGLDIPEDFHWTARRWLAKTENPQAYLDKVEKEGLSASQLVRQIREDLGQIEAKTIEACPKCQTPLTHVACPKCHEVIKHKGAA